MEEGTMNPGGEAQVEKGIETAMTQSFLLWEQGYKMGTTLPNGQSCEPGVICVHRPQGVIKPGEINHYLVDLYPETDEVASDPDRWHYTCGCPFFQRTERVFGKGTCKHGLWVLRHFQGLLSRQTFVQHVLSVVAPRRPAPFPPPERTLESTQRIYDRQRAVIDQRREAFADALHGGHRCEAQGDRSNRAPSYPALPSPPTRPGPFTATRKGDFDN